jgi:hypothetical protein
MGRIRPRTGWGRTQKCAKTNRQSFLALVGWRHVMGRMAGLGPRSLHRPAVQGFGSGEIGSFDHQALLVRRNLVFTWREFNPTNSSTRFFSDDGGTSFRVRNRWTESTRRSPPLPNCGSAFRTLQRS